ncbi:hypothetical protein Emed_004487 [Eimeria media]
MWGAAISATCSLERDRGRGPLGLLRGLCWEGAPLVDGLGGAPPGPPLAAAAPQPRRQIAEEGQLHRRGVRTPESSPSAANSLWQRVKEEGPPSSHA